jgi:3-isopropylmalate/(R)-2-methylmalate dehydratase small subunit
LEIASGKECPRNDTYMEIIMAQFTTLTSRVVPLPVNDIDTDQIIPAQFLKVTDKNGLADALFYNWRYNDDKSPKADFIINKPESKGAQILLAGDNFGCGSSREHAPWALTSYGFRAVISTSFADIFRSNSLKNGLIPIIVDEATQKMLFDLVEEVPNTEFSVDLASQTLTFPHGFINFPIDPFSKACLLNGVDELGYILGFEKEIAAYESKN